MGRGLPSRWNGPARLPGCHPGAACRWSGEPGSPRPRPYVLAQHAGRTGGRGSRPRQQRRETEEGPGLLCGRRRSVHRGRRLGMSSAHANLPCLQDQWGAARPRSPSFRLGETGPAYGVLKGPAFPSDPCHGALRALLVVPVLQVLHDGLSSTSLESVVSPSGTSWRALSIRPGQGSWSPRPWTARRLLATVRTSLDVPRGCRCRTSAYGPRSSRVA